MSSVRNDFKATTKLADLIRPPVLSAQLETVTPALAADLLRNNSHNRPLRKSLVSQFARDMESGQWQVNGEAIQISVTGRVLNGQHRLTAIVSANVPVQMLVVRNVPDDSFSTIDTGMKRTVGQILGMKDVKNSSVVASAARWILMIERMINSTNDMAVSIISAPQIMDCIAQHPSIHHYAALHAGSSNLKSLIPSACHAVHVLGAEKYGQDNVDDWIDSIGSGANIGKGDPAYMLRERLIANSSRISRLSTIVIVALTAKAQRAHIEGRTMGVLRWSANETFPEI